jgi:ATP-binding cassette, subfamily B, bacterial
MDDLDAASFTAESSAEGAPEKSLNGADDAKGKSRFRADAVTSRWSLRQFGDVAAIKKSGSFEIMAWLRLILAAAADLRFLRARMTARVPYVAQVESSDCGHAALAMALQYCGVPISLSQVKSTLGSGRDGLSARRMLEFARAHGVYARGVRSSLSGLRQLPAGSILFWDFNHFVVLQAANHRWVSVLDPVQGLRRIKMAQAERSYTGVALEFIPSLPIRRKWRRARASDASGWRYFKAFLPQRSTLASMTATSGLLMASAFLLSFATDYVVSHVSRGRHGSLGVDLLLAAGTCALVYLCTLLLRGLTITAVHTRSEKVVTLGLLSHMVGLPFGYFAGRSVGDLTLRVRTSALVRQTLSGPALSAGFDTGLIMIYVVALFFVDRFLSLVVLAFLVLQIAIPLLWWGRQRQLSAETMEAQSRAQSELVEMLDGMVTLKALGVEGVAAERWSHSFIDELNARARSARDRAISVALSGAMQFAAPLVVLALGVERVQSGVLPLGRALGFMALTVGLFAPLSALVQSCLQLAGLGPVLRRMSDVLNTEREDTRPGAIHVDHVVGDIEIRNLSFAYPGCAEVLHDISMAVRAGQTAVILGPSGCGKSTLASLIVGIYRMAEGAILIDGVDISRLEPRSLRRSIGYVDQHSHLFIGSIRDNIAMGSPEASFEEVRRAACMAEIDADILAMPMGYETLLGTGGVGLSGGQRQRIALARALLRRPKLMVLDEVTSGLEPMLEEKILQNLRGAGVTLLVISHRPRISAIADRTFIIKAGCIAADRHADDASEIADLYESLDG